MSSSGGPITGGCSYTIGVAHVQGSVPGIANCALARGGRKSILVGSAMTPPQK